MFSDISQHLARELAADRLRTAQARQPAASSIEARSRQRRLVQASLLLTRRLDRPTKQRWA